MANVKQEIIDVSDDEEEETMSKPNTQLTVQSAHPTVCYFFVTHMLFSKY